MLEEQQKPKALEQNGTDSVGSPISNGTNSNGIVKLEEEKLPAPEVSYLIVFYFV